jgi:hypothetical protein
MGRGARPSQIFIIDFGLSKPFAAVRCAHTSRSSPART